MSTQVAQLTVIASEAKQSFMRLLRRCAPRNDGLILLFVISVFLSGCATSESVKANKEAQSALSSVAGAMSGRQLSDQEIRDLEKQIRTDKEAQTAIQAIAESLGLTAPLVKYCPVTGRRWAPHFDKCPEHHVPLEMVGP